MTEIPEHLRKRAEAARAKAEAEKGEAAAADAAAADAPAGAETPADPAESRIPAHLLERSRAAKAKAEGGEAAEAGGGGVAVAERPSAVTAVGAGRSRRRARRRRAGWSHPAAPHRRQVRLHPGRQGHAGRQGAHLAPPAGRRVRGLAGLPAFTFVFSVFVNAPLLQLANPNRTPNPSKAPWYFLGLQELLTMFHPMVAGVTIPGMGLILLAVTPYMDRNPSNKPEDRKFAISVFTIFMMFWAVLVLIGSFFRGPG